eukprot:TRINITY_DN35143_c0_g1_i1.p1 TRINITY_DN35143_c0_g1~~TRINITY_DN35143_c0_g1_i1.p1  ORF type:complete len:251 (+),score=42.64 TRINITY_DN35143_c0_g1_i1:27-755(+)
MSKVSADIKKIVAEYVATPWTGIAEVKAKVAEVAPKMQLLRQQGVDTNQRLFIDELYTLCSPAATTLETPGNFIEEIILLSIFICRMRSSRLQALEDDNTQRVNKRQKTAHLKSITRERDQMQRDNKTHIVTIPRLCDQIASLLTAYELKDESDKPHSMAFSFEWYTNQHGCKQHRRNSLMEHLRELQGAYGFLRVDDKSEKIDSSSVSLKQAQAIARHHGVPSSTQEEYSLLFAGGAAFGC